MDVYFYEAFEEEEVSIRSFLPPFLKAEFTWKTIQESGHDAPPSPLVSTRTQSTIPVSWAAGLDGILSRSTGFDHLKRYREAAGREDIALGYLPLYCNRSVAEQAMLLWMALLRKLKQQQKQFAGFERDGLTGSETRGKRLLVVGVGNIGYEVVKIGRGLEMQVTGVDIVKRHSDVVYEDIDNAIQKADIIVCTMNLTEDNHSYFDYRCLKKAGTGVLFINVARGEMSPSADLLRLIEEGHLGGVALDVYNEEALLADALRNRRTLDHPETQAVQILSTKENVICTPHNAFNTRESVERKAQQSVDQILHFREHKRFKWPVP